MTATPTGNLKLTSQSFGDSKLIPQKYTCKGAGVNPPLAISGVPAEAKSLALTMHDPDAPVGDYVHWVMWNIAPDTSTIAENSVPPGALQGQNSSQHNAYLGPCPPSGAHHYIFELYALDTSLNLPTGATRQQLEAAMQSHIIAQTKLTGLFATD